MSFSNLKRKSLYVGFIVFPVLSEAPVLRYPVSAMRAMNVRYSGISLSASWRDRALRGACI